MNKIKCQITNRELPIEKLTPFVQIRKQILELIYKDCPTFAQGQYISTVKLNRYRQLYLKKLINKEHRNLNKLELEVLNAIKNKQILSENIEPEIELTLTLGQRVADKIADFGGSWIFIVLFFSFILVWVGINIWLLTSKPFDPYPFILLNLILSCLAAIQAPVIMMSQNRQEQKDRDRNEQDYKINLKAELEIRLLNEKVDHMMAHQNRRLLEIQKIQLEYLEQLIGKKQKN